MTDEADFNSDNTTVSSDVKGNKLDKPSLKLVSPGDSPESSPIPEKIKLSPAQVQAQLVQFLERKDVDLLTPFPLRNLNKFPHDYRIYRERIEDKPLLVEINEAKTASITSPDNLQSDLASYCGQLAGIDSCFNITLTQAEKIVKWFMFNKRPPQKLPPPWGFKSFEGICFNRLDYDPIPVAPHFELDIVAPTFAEMLCRTSNSDSFCARLGSMFFEDASRKQVGCLYGESGGGKSQLDAILRALLGTAAATFKNADFEDKFIMAEFLDKRTAVVEECDPKFYQSIWFKIFTGGRKTRIRKIHTQGCPGEINTILWTVSNEAPEIPNDPALINRVIPWEVTPIAKDKKLPELEVHRRLKAEAPYIAGYCIMRYRELCPNHEEITYDQSKHLQPLIDGFESEYIEKLEEWFVIGPDLFMTTKMFNAACKRAELYTAEDKKKFLRFVNSRYPYVKKDRGYIDGTRYRGVLGLRDS